MQVRVRPTSSPLARGPKSPAVQPALPSALHGQKESPQDTVLATSSPSTGGGHGVGHQLSKYRRWTGHPTPRTPANGTSAVPEPEQQQVCICAANAA